MLLLDTELTDDVLKHTASKLSDIGNEWRTLGFYLNINKDILVKFHEMPNTKTKSKVYTMLKIWRDNTRDASLSQLKGIISKFELTQSTTVSSASTLSK